MPITADYTTFEHFQRWFPGNAIGEDGIDIDNCTFRLNQAGYFCVNLSEITTNRFTSFSNNTITGNSYGFAGPLTTAASQYEFDNLDISTVATTNAIRAANGYVNEFINSNFDVSKVNLQSTGAILSKNHNDSANDCQMLIPTGFNMDNFTNTLSGQNVTVYKHASYSPNLKLNNGGSGRTYGGLIIPTGSKVTHEQGHILTVTGETNITGDYFVGTGGDAPTAAANLITGALTLNSGGEFRAPTTTTIGNAAPSTPVGARNMYVPTGATFTHNNGLLKFTGANNVCLSHTPAAGAGHRYYDIEVDASGTVTYTDVENDRPFYIENDLTIASGSTFQNQGNDDLFQCDGTINCNGTLNTSVGGNFTFNNLTIPTGGTYNATDETTTITGAYRNTGGTFTAN